MAHRSRSVASTRPADKVCAVCGRTITWRKKWERDWEQVRYCSDSCRRTAHSGGGAEQALLLVAVEQRLARCPVGATVCPSEIARAVFDERGGSGDGWRSLMEPVRRAARLLAAQGRCEFTQRGQVVDPSSARGPVRLRPIR